MTKKVVSKKAELDVEKINAALNNNRDTFPVELISGMTEYGLASLARYLESVNAPGITAEVIDALGVLIDRLESKAKGRENNGLSDDLTGWAIGTIGRGMVELGEPFHTPSGII